MKRVKISELKAKLSGYLAEVRAGETVVVCDRNTPVAQLVPVDEAVDRFSVERARERLPRVGQLPRVSLRRSIDVVKLLREDRDQR